MSRFWLWSEIVVVGFDNEKLYLLKEILVAYHIINSTNTISAMKRYIS